LRIVNTRIYRVDSRCVVRWVVGPLVTAWALAIDQGRPVAGARGDSGGPVVMPEAIGTNLHAVGTISAAHADFFGCFVYDGTECTSDVLYADITDVLKLFRSTLR
jgi:hypothetical protein